MNKEFNLLSQKAKDGRKKQIGRELGNVSNHLKNLLYGEKTDTGKRGKHVYKNFNLFCATVISNWSEIEQTNV